MEATVRAVLLLSMLCCALAASKHRSGYGLDPEVNMDAVSL